jgi:hypothetical protein
MTRSNVLVRLQASLLDEARRVAESEGVALNQLINVAEAEKLSALRTEDYFREWAARPSVEKPKGVLEWAGEGKPSLPGDTSYGAIGNDGGGKLGVRSRVFPWGSKGYSRTFRRRNRLHASLRQQG